MDLIDVTDWATIRAEEMGRDERKAWIARSPSVSREQWWLWKPCLPTGNGTERRLNDVAEAITYQLAQAIGLPTAECHLATRQGQPGVISRNVSPPEVELIHGSAVCQSHDYGLSAISTALGATRGPSPCGDMTGFQVFAGYLVLDAWVANTDRHGENWAVLQSASGAWALAPAFDHGSALGSGLTDQNRRSREVSAFCAKGSTRHFVEGGSLLELAGAAVESSGAGWWPQRVSAVEATSWSSMLDQVEGLSVVARNFIDGILKCNQERVSRLWQP
jgi:hypothetical protein